MPEPNGRQLVRGARSTVTVLLAGLFAPLAPVMVVAGLGNTGGGI
ncbi:hypothetical protein [Pseudomonas cavernicola]|nr:hypothetical protein [Pseudomonas cavernicola]